MLSNDFGAVGTPVVIEDKEGHQLDKQVVKNITHNIDTVNMTCKDIRSSFTDMVIDQQFVPADFVNDATPPRTIMSADTAKAYKADAAGYCRGVPGVCLNDYAFDSGLPGVWDAGFRYFRFSYGEFAYKSKDEIDKTGRDDKGNIISGAVEVESDQGWFWLEPDKYSTITMQETLPNGAAAKVNYLKISALVTNPPKEGEKTPNYEGPGRNIRLTGTFHNELANPTDCLTIFKYLLKRYSTLEYIPTWFDTCKENGEKGEIETELSKLAGYPMGLYIDSPTDLFKVIGELQNGGVYGWQLTTYNALITARVDDPDRTPAMTIPYNDIINITELTENANAENYVSNLKVNYAHNYSDGKSAEYTNRDIENQVLNARIVSKSKTIETLLKEKDHAQKRFDNQIAVSLGICPVIEGIKLRGFAKYRGLRPYDFVNINFFDEKSELSLTSRTEWKVIAVDLDFKNELVTIGVQAKPDSVK
jgi:hypothetical protein